MTNLRLIYNKKLFVGYKKNYMNVFNKKKKHIRCQE